MSFVSLVALASLNPSNFIILEDTLRPITAPTVLQCCCRYDDECLQYYRLPCIIQVDLPAQQDDQQAAKKLEREVWLPEGEITLQPFLHPCAKRQKTSLVSRSSNATSGQSLEPGASVGADGSNNDASKDSNESEREPQSVGVQLCACANISG